MENNFIRMAGSAGQAVAYTIGPILYIPMASEKLSFKR